MKRLLMVTVVLAATALPASTAAASDTLVTVGSPTTPFSQNKQNEPALAIDAADPSILVSGSNDNIDEEACNAGDDTTCPFTTGIGGSGVYFSFDAGAQWVQPTYTGLTARGCLGAPGPDAPCTPQVGPIGTLPWYYENGLVADGDPAVAIGPRPSSGGFSWSNGPRLYFANLTSNVSSTRTDRAIRGFEGIAVSRADDLQAAAAGDKAAWCVGAQGCAPVVISRQSSTTFSDKEQVWADNAASSRYFGTVYVCWASFVGQEKGNAAPAPLQVAVSHDGGDSWSQHPISAAADNGQRNPADGCTIRTDSKGNAYVFGVGTSSSGGEQAYELMSVSANGGRSWSSPRPVAGPVHQPGVFDPGQGSFVIDGMAGARSDLSPAPSVDIANGAPNGTDATDHIVMSYVSGTLAAPHVEFTESVDHGSTWLPPRAIETAGDRGFYAAPAISPNGTDVYVVYNAFTTPYRDNTTDPRSLLGVVLHADSSLTSTGPFGEINRSSPGDPRASSSNDLSSEFLGDYVYAVAGRDYGAAVWNDVSNAADCPALDDWRASLQAGTPGVRPAPQQDCPATFGNSDIRGGAYPDPTP